MSLSHGNAPRPSGGARMARTAGMLALFTLLSRLLGLVRDMGMAWMVGCGPVADALVAALRLPHLLRRLLGEGSLSMTLTAWLVRHDVAQGQGDPLPALASGLFRRLVLVLGGLVLLGMLAAPQLLAFLAPALSPEALAEGSSLLRLCLLYVLLAGGRHRGCPGGTGRGHERRGPGPVAGPMGLCPSCISGDRHGESGRRALRP